MINGLDRFSIYGFNIHEDKIRVVPKIKLSRNAPVSDEFRKEFDLWLLEKFGTREESIVPKGFGYMFNNSIILNPHDVIKIRNLI